MAGVALFDLDNTLIDREGAFRTWAVGFLADRRLDPDALGWLVQVDDNGRASRRQLFEAVQRRFGLPEPVEDLVEPYLAEVAGRYRPEPAVLGSLASLRAAGWRTGVVTNGAAVQEDKIRSAGLDGVLDAWCISELEGVAKPARPIFEAAAARCGCALDGWMVGDTPEVDILGGLQAGLRTIWMARGRTWEPTDYAPDFVADDVAHAVSFILS